MALEDDIVLLSGVPMLEVFEREALRLLAFSADTRRLRRGEILFSKDEPSDGGYIVVRGALRLDDGKGALVDVPPGNLVGERALIADIRRNETAIALDETIVLRLSRALFRRTLEEYPETAARLADRLRHQIASLTGDLGAVRARLDKIR